MARRMLYTFTVTGSWPFPFDMLRYDRCYPADGNASGALEALAQPQTGEMIGIKYKIKLSGFGLTEARWASFGWIAEESEHEWL